MILEIPMAPPSHNELRRKYHHWAAYKKLRLEWEWALLAAGKGRTTFAVGDKKHRVEIHVRHKRLFDPDNLVAGLKPCLDALVEQHFIYSDSPKWLELVMPTQELGAPPLTRIEIEEVAGDGY